MKTPINTQRFLLAVTAVFLFLFAFEWFLHGFLLTPFYEITPYLWRPQNEINSFFPWLLLGQVMTSLVFCFIFLKGYQDRGIVEGARYGFFLSLFLLGPTLIRYAVEPLPLNLIVIWMVGIVIKFVGAGVLLSFLYLPKEE